MSKIMVDAAVQQIHTNVSKDTMHLEAKCKLVKLQRNMANFYLSYSLQLNEFAQTFKYSRGRFQVKRAISEWTGFTGHCCVW